MATSKTGKGDIIGEATAHPAFIIKYRGVFDYDGITTFVIKWFKKRKFNVNEKKHKHKMSCPHGLDIDWGVEFWKKIDDYYMYQADVQFRLWNARQVEVVKDGKKKMLWYAELKVVIGMDVVCDYMGRWETNQFFERLRNFYDQYIIKVDIRVRHVDPFYYKLLDLQTEIKKKLEMEAA